MAIVLLALAVYRLAAVAASPWGQRLFASDLTEGYIVGARRYVETGSPYTAEQLAGPWLLDYHSFIHPPSALLLFVPFLVLPVVLWWLIPLVTTACAVAWLRPAPWSWPLMAACLLWPRSTGSLLAGNTDIWAMAFVAAGAVVGWPVVGLLIKPTFALVALVGLRHRATWIALALALPIVLMTLPAWLDWLTVIGNASLQPTYSLLNLPLVLLPALAYAGRTRRRGPILSLRSS